MKREILFTLFLAAVGTGVCYLAYLKRGVLTYGLNSIRLKRKDTKDHRKLQKLIKSYSLNSLEWALYELKKEQEKKENG